MAQQRIEIADLIENRPLGWYQVFVVGCGFLVLLVDGLDYSAANVGAPAIIRAFNLDKSAMGLVFGWGNFGILCGSFILGYLGDRFGRKTGALTGVLFYSVPTLLVYFATSVGQLEVLRFFAGLGIGGVIPNVIALLTETAPSKYRASFVMVSFVAYSLGNFAVSLVAAWLVPVFGWWIVFVVGGTSGVVLGLLLLFILPESMRFLALHRPDSPALRNAVRRLAPDLAIAANTQFYLQAPPKEKISWRQLFVGDQRRATPLLWIGFFAESLTFMTFISWLAVILEAKGLAPQQAALVYSYGAASGIVTILIVSRFLDRFGPMAGAVTALCGIAAVVMLASDGLSPMTIVVGVIAANGLLTCTHNSLNGIVGVFYPTGVRSKGVGYATGMGRIALVSGPVIAGFLLSAHLPVRQLLYLMAVPYLLVAGICVALGLLYQRRFAHGEAVAAQAADEGGAPRLREAAAGR